MNRSVVVSILIIMLFALSPLVGVANYAVNYGTSGEINDLEKGALSEFMDSKKLNAAKDLIENAFKPQLIEYTGEKSYYPTDWDFS